MRVLAFPAAYASSIEEAIRRTIRDLDRMPAEQREIFLTHPTLRDRGGVCIIGVLPEDAHQTLRDAFASETKETDHA